MTPIPIHAAMKAAKNDAKKAGSDRRPAGPLPPGSGPALPGTDARWLLAARASLAATGASQIHPHARDRLADWANEQGIAPIHASAIIDIAERASRRGGLDAADAERIARMPAPRPRSTTFARDRAAIIIVATIPTLVGVALVLLFARG